MTPTQRRDGVEPTAVEPSENRFASWATDLLVEMLRELAGSVFEQGSESDLKIRAAADRLEALYRATEPLTADDRDLLDGMLGFYSEHDGLKLPFTLSGRAALKAMRDGEAADMLPWNARGPSSGGAATTPSEDATESLSDAVPEDGWYRLSPALLHAITEPRERDVSVRACNVLASADLRTMQAVRGFLAKEPEGLSRLNKCGPRIAAFIKERVTARPSRPALSESESPRQEDSSNV